LAIDEQDLCLEIFSEWLSQRSGRSFHVEERPFGELTARYSDGEHSIAVRVRLLLDASEHDVWQANRMLLEGEMGVGLPGAFALWLPPGADLPVEVSEVFRQRVREAALALQPGERGQVSLPVKLHLRKVDNEGAVVSVVGGLNPYWARMSERVRGSFDLDSMALHRLPESEEEQQVLVRLVCDHANRIDRLGHWSDIDAVDTWTIQRLRSRQGFLIVGVPRELTADAGASVRRNLRRILGDAGPKLAAAGTDLTALLLLGSYDYIDQENVTTALRGFDPGLYMGIDFVCVVADGRLKAITERAGSLS
jgi:hypothetical protein